MYRFITGAQVQQLAAIRKQTLMGVVAWQHSQGRTDHVWLATSPQLEEQAVAALLPRLLEQRQDRRRMLLDYPGGQARFAIEQAGFHILQTLIWMRLKL
jgi:hypothetical protein